MIRADDVIAAIRTVIQLGSVASWSSLLFVALEIGKAARKRVFNVKTTGCSSFVTIRSFNNSISG